jgi:glucose-1-phosphatase
VTIAVVLFDFDGVVRHWDPAVNEAIEQRHGLAPGSILDTAFGPELGLAAIDGTLDYDAWVARIAELLGSAPAVAEWGELVEAVKEGGCRVALLSNATTRLEEDLEHLGLGTTFDDVFSTAHLGVCKPDHEVYRRVVDALGVDADHIAFTDDTPSWAEAATEVGLHGIPFTGVTHLREELQRLGVRV